MKRAATAIAAIVAAAALLGPASAHSAETLINFTGPKKLKVGKRIGYTFVCAVACNVTVADRLTGPGIKANNGTSGSLQPGVVGGFGGKPNGPLLQNLRENPGRFKLSVTLTASDPLTGETDIDKRTFGFK